ncbi:MAG: MBL fold metallo-hydrolase [Agrococcus casei]|uniref:MBL fold metallo-hydrolase n=1 Tax=Agrococcus casei TaxID=343512 RepID=UPI003F8D9029
MAITRILAPNPGPMTLDGTNTWLLPDGIVIDPGPEIESHLDAICEHNVRLVLVSHWHGDHTDAVDTLHKRTGAPVRALDPAWCRAAEPLTDGEVIGDLRVLAVPGHTADSVAFVTGDAVLTGDTVLGSGTTVIMHPDGSIADYFASLDKLEALGDLRVLPGHGEELPSIAAIAREYRDHRLERLDEVRDALATAGIRADDAAALATVADSVYASVPDSLRPAVEAMVHAQLAFVQR